MPPKKTQQKAAPIIKSPALKLRPVRPTVGYSIPGYSCLNDVNPAVGHIYPKKKGETLAEPYTIVGVDVSARRLHVAEKAEPLSMYMKVVHLLDPQRFMKTPEGYVDRPSSTFWNFGHGDLRFHHNKAYTEAVAYHYANTIGIETGVPHYVGWLGSVRAFAEEYKYDMDVDFETYRFRRWFWEHYDAGWYDIRLQDKGSGRVLEREELEALFRPDADALTDTSSVSSDEDDEEDEEGDEEDEEDVEGADADALSFEDLDVDVAMEMAYADAGADTIGNADGAAAADLESVTSFSVASSASELPTPRDAIDGQSHRPYSVDDEEDSVESITDKYECFVILRKMPVLITFLEAQDGVLDEDLEESGEPSAERDARWLAWLFQIVAALAVLQERLGLTHNDLHSNNVLWQATDQEYLYYKWGASGKHYRVPTYGRILKIIDFGRAIYGAADKKVQMISSDYYDSNDAAGMYNFGAMTCDDEPRRMPNRAFDLALFTCSALRSLFYVNPEPVAGGAILSSEDGLAGPWTVRATASPLFNLLWSWVVGKDKRSIYETEDGCERWEGFGLYIGLAEHAVAGVPADQFGKEWVKAFEYVPAPGTMPSAVGVIQLP